MGASSEHTGQRASRYLVVVRDAGATAARLVQPRDEEGEGLR